MKFLCIPLVALLGAAVSPAMAQCTGTPLSSGQITGLVLSNLVCGRAVKPGYPGSASDRFQEEHIGTSVGGAIWDFKMGSGHPVDPRKLMGQWSTGSNSFNNATVGTITHNYGAISFTWLVFGPTSNTPGASTYSFCTAGASPVEHVRAFVVPINAGSGCGGAYPP